MVNWTAALRGGTLRSVGANPCWCCLQRACSHSILKRYVLCWAAAGSSSALPQESCRNKAISQAERHGQGNGVEELKLEPNRPRQLRTKTCAGSVRKQHVERAACERVTNLAQM